MRQLSDERSALGHEACPTTVANLLRGLGYNLRVNRKCITGPYHPERDRQFHYIEAIIEDFRSQGLAPVSSDGRTAREQRIIAGFEDIERFVEKHGRLPEHGEDKDIFDIELQ